jgi:hypothetical protein
MFNVYHFVTCDGLRNGSHCHLKIKILQNQLTNVYVFRDWAEYVPNNLLPRAKFLRDQRRVAGIFFPVVATLHE